MSHLTDNRRHNIITASNAWSAVYERQKLWRQMTLREAPFEGNEMTEAQLKEWLKNNLEIDVSRDLQWDAGNSVYVGLRFRGERDTFSYERISIPAESN